jgi:hypothetical protein
MAARSGFASLVGVLALACGAAGCGADESASSGASTQGPLAAPDDCKSVGHIAEGQVRLCFDPESGDEHGHFVVDDGSMWRELAISPPGPTATASDAGKAGHWAWAAISPDEKTILAQWSAECEVPIAFLMDVRDGTPKPVTGEADWAKSPESVALGWTTDGRAIVFLPKGPACGTGANVAGVYLYSKAGDGKLLLRAEKAPIRASKTPRTLAAVRGSATG